METRHCSYCGASEILPVERLVETPTKLVGGLEHVSFSHISGMSSSQLTNPYFFQRGRYTPPKSWDPLIHIATFPGFRLIQRLFLQAPRCHHAFVVPGSARPGSGVCGASKFRGECALGRRLAFCGVLVQSKETHFTTLSTCIHIYNHIYICMIYVYDICI